MSDDNTKTTILEQLIVYLLKLTVQSYTRAIFIGNYIDRKEHMNPGNVSVYIKVCTLDKRPDCLQEG